MTRPLLLSLLMALCALPSVSQGAISGRDLLTQKSVEISPGKKGTVVVFLSSKCPCSDSHLPVLKQLSADFRDFNFVAVHSNADEAPESTKAYFAAAKLAFPVLQDENLRLANDLRANKTPHAFVLSPEGKVLYRGGVTSSANAPDAKRQYLRDTLRELSEGKALSQSETRTLGCVIAR